MPNKKCAIIISVSSDIGMAMFERWSKNNWDVYGTYRTETDWTKAHNKNRQKFVFCDLSDSVSVSQACSKLRQLCSIWDVLVVLPGTQEPVGPFIDCDFNVWEKSIRVNFINQMRIIQKLLPFRSLSLSEGACVLTFAGGGTNNATLNYSAYTVSKIALIKMCELLDAEIPDTRFAIVGPGWVKTKIHNSTLKAGARAGDNYQRTIDKLASDECTPMDKVLDCCDWLINSPRKFVSGRNFSVVFDMWGSKDLEKKLAEESDMYKLRRFGNDFLIRKKEKYEKIRNT